MALSLQQPVAISLRRGPISKPSLSSFQRVSVSLPIKSLISFKQQVPIHQKCPFVIKCSNSSSVVLEDPLRMISLFDSIDGTFIETICHCGDKTKKAASEIASIIQIGSSSVNSALNQVENTSGKLIPRMLLLALVKKLQNEEHYQDALEVYQWMMNNNREKRYKFMTPAETHMLLYLIAKVYGVSSAEEYLLKLPDSLKNKELYNVLLIQYAIERNVIKAESLFDEMRNRGYLCNYAAPFNVMMLLYQKIESCDKMRSMLEENISSLLLNSYSYDIWLSICRTQQCFDRLLEHVKLRETNLDNLWGILNEDLMYIYFTELKQREKAEECLKVLESKLTNQLRGDKWSDRDQAVVEGLMENYTLLGDGETREIHRLWETHIGLHQTYYNSDEHDVIRILLQLHDVEGAEKIYDEWVSHGPTNLKTSKANFFLEEIMDTQGLSEKVEPFFDKMIESGIIPNLETWEILTRYNIKMRRISKALSCLRKCFEENYKCQGHDHIIHYLIKLCEEEGDMTSKNALFNLLREMDCDVNVFK